MRPWFPTLKYIWSKVNTARLTHLPKLRSGQISEREYEENFLKDIFQKRLTMFRTVKGEEMEPTLSNKGESLLVRRWVSPYDWSVFVGDVVLVKNPLEPTKELVRRVAAVQGDEMASTDPNDDSFLLQEGECWVLCDNTSLSPKDAFDSRTFGPVSMSNIFGRVIYKKRSDYDHGFVENSEKAMEEDYPVLAVELDTSELPAGSEKT